MSPAEKGALKQQFGSLAIWLVKSWCFLVNLWSVGFSWKSHHPGKGNGLEASVLPSQELGPGAGCTEGGRESSPREALVNLHRAPGDPRCPVQRLPCPKQVGGCRHRPPASVRAELSEEAQTEGAPGPHPTCPTHTGPTASAEGQEEHDLGPAGSGAKRVPETTCSPAGPAWRSRGPSPQPRPDHRDHRCVWAEPEAMRLGLPAPRSGVSGPWRHGPGPCQLQSALNAALESQHKTGVGRPLMRERQTAPASFTASLKANRWLKSGSSGKFIFLGSKITWLVTVAIKLKDACSLEGKPWQT